MSMKTYANHGWVIPKTVLSNHFGEDFKFLEEHSEDFQTWLEGDGDGDDENNDRFQEINQKIVDWGKANGLDLIIDCAYMDEDNEDEEAWLCFCSNAYTINPVFKEIGGEEILWTTFG